jgi:hypothetical protein
MAIKDLTHTRLIVGEGGRDAEFLGALCAKKGIDYFQIANVEGSSTFGSLAKLRILPGYDNLSALLIFGDNDEQAGKSFESIKNQLNDADLASPSKPLRIARKKDSPPVAVVMMPFTGIGGNSEGCLETLLLPAIGRAHPREIACVDALFACTGADQWKTKSSRDKLLVRCTLSVSCEANPMCGAPEWYKSRSNLIPLDDAIFNPLSRLLESVPAWFESGIDNWEDWGAAQ